MLGYHIYEVYLKDSRDRLAHTVSVAVYHNHNASLRSNLTQIKDHAPLEKKSGVVHNQCSA